MPNWNQLLNEINAAEGKHDVIRRRYLKKVFKITGRNVIIYYSGWLQKENIAGIEINDEDKNGFSTFFPFSCPFVEPPPPRQPATATAEPGR